MPADLFTLLIIVIVAAGIALAIHLLSREDPDAVHHAVGPFSVEVAHEVWQTHSECAMQVCPSKHTAYWTLAGAGKLVADDRAAR